MKTDYFNGFKWFLPKSFADALSKCLFEVGDTIYDTPNAYSLPWGEAKNIINNSIQIKSISQVNISMDNINAESVFFDNWDSEVVFDFYFFPTLEKREIKSTQGRLYSFLWKGDDNYILSKNFPAEKPIMLKTVFKKKSDFQISISDKVNNQCDFVFYYPIDETSELSNEKTQKIIKIFNSKRNSIIYKFETYTPQELNIGLASSFCPTIKFIVFEINGSLNDVELALKDALYKPNKNKNSKKDTFRLNSHGLLVRKN